MKLIYTADFIQRATSLHKNRYSYPRTIYVSSNQKVIITCSIHGDFTQTPNKHLCGRGCRNCQADAISKRCLGSTETFITAARKVHNEHYDYSLVEYQKSNRNVIIVCLKHGPFEQRPNNHLAGLGCPICKISKGEARIFAAASKFPVIVKSQVRFENCRHINPLPFDIGIFQNSVCIALIEFQGIQHFEPVRWSKSISLKQAKRKLQECQLRDRAKEKYCFGNHIPLLVVTYKEMNQLESLVSNFLASETNVQTR